MKENKNEHKQLPIHKTNFTTLLKEEQNKRESHKEKLFKTVNLDIAQRGTF